MARTLIVFLCGAILGAAVLGMPSGLFGKEEDPHAKYGRQIPQTPEAQAEMMKKWQAVATPGTAHERLAFFAGKWQVEGKMWMGEAPMESKGESTFRWLMDGRWMAQEYKSSMPGMGEYEGFGIMGYDNYRKQYVGSWVDNMGTALLTFAGGIDRTGRVIEQYGAMDEPMLDQVGKTARYVTRITGDDSFVFEIHDLDIIGGRTMVIEMTYTRIKTPR